MKLEIWCTKITFVKMKHENATQWCGFFKDGSNIFKFKYFYASQINTYIRQTKIIFRIIWQIGTIRFKSVRQ